MSDIVLEQTVVVKNEKGLHLRPVELLVKAAMRFEARVTLSKDGQAADCKNMLSVMTLGAEQGTALGLTAEGNDAAEAIAALTSLFDDGFHEMETSEPE